jgi:hypothetical protein
MSNRTIDARDSVTAMASREPVRSKVERRLSSLIALHAIAIEADKQAWNSVSDTCEVLEANPAYVQPKVHTSSLLQWGPDGQESVPQYSSTEEEIKRDIGRHMDTALSLRTHPSLKSQYEALKASYEQRIGRALEELRQQMADYKRLEDEAGYTSALERARSTKAAVIEAEKRIVEFVPSDWKEAAQKARWAAATYKDDHAYLFDQDNDGDVLVRILSTIGEIG